MKAITVRLPYAAAIRAGTKLVENRGRPTAYRGPVAIHAAAAWSKAGGHDPRIRRWWWGDRWADRSPLDATDFSRMFRNIVAVADLEDCHQAAEVSVSDWCCNPWGDFEYNDKPAWHLVLANVVVLDEPVPAVGRLSVPWELPADVAAKVAAQLGAVTR